ncbi:MAG TPA: 4-hydroxythreonine-4-phosphate dehydrogenase PdxA [Gammaproteobacteria bacterium]|nr:4-hydroxythreonine-4-phosphate dehydrogenase PdxA [Gammaproteobacteria bacterium]
MSKSSTPKLPIVITPGEPLGVGPDIVIKLTQKKWSYPYLIIGDPESLKKRAKQLNLSFNPKLIIPVKLSKRYVLDCLDLATKYCLQKKAAALITGPVNKAMINQAGFTFSGHTHYLAKITKTKDPVMFFLSEHFKLALVTDHISLAEVPKAITRKRLIAVINTVANFIQSSRIAICGLNPHAGENGYLGKEEIKIITPVIKSLQKQKKLNLLSGPYSADSLFHEKNLKNFDAIIAMYHDQGLSVLKHRDFKKAVNITLGLPFLRTSVDHGTAIDLAGTGKADSSNLEYVFAKTVELLHA